MMNKTMKAVVTMGSGGMEQLVYKDVPIPELQANEVLVRVLAAGVNNTEINTRLGWYSAKVSESTNNMADNVDQQALADGGWNA
ncbi:MAG: alcohol dehydrogenase, partial [Shewanella psychromarinicola]